MTEISQSVAVHELANDWLMRPLEVLRYRLACLVLRLRPVWRETKRISKWLEAAELAEARESGQSKMRMKILADGTATIYPGRDRSHRRRIRGYPHLFGFLDSLGIGHIEFDPRLEANQVGDLVRLLYAFRRSIRGRQEGRPLPDCISKLFTDEGLRAFCTRARLRDDVLSIEYSYCMTRFSRLVKWFEGWHRSFGDHRALFDAAPRYGLIAAVLGVLGPVVSLISDQRWLMWTVTAVAAVAIFVLIYSFFMTVGSLEYDNEQKAYRLTRAYDQAHRYAKRIQNDLQRARAVQAKIIPKIEQLPLVDRLEWAASFLPQAEVGGDYFDAAPIDEHRVAILFSDVSGHGLAAAMVTALLKVNFRIWVAEDWDLGRFIAHLNKQLCELTPDDSYASVFLGVYDTAAGELTYINGGHSPLPRLVAGRPNNPVTLLSEAHTLLLGVAERQVVAPARLELRSGDTLMFVTDGIEEAQGANGEMYGTQRLDDFIDENRDRPPAELIRGLTRNVEEFARHAAPTDDRTVLAMRVR